MIALEPRPGHSEAISTMALTRVDVVSLVSPLLCPHGCFASVLFYFLVFCLQPGQGLIKGEKQSFPTSFLYDYKRKRGRTSKRDCQEEFGCVGKGVKATEM